MPVRHNEVHHSLLAGALVAVVYLVSLGMGGCASEGSGSGPGLLPNTKDGGGGSSGADGSAGSAGSQAGTGGGSGSGGSVQGYGQCDMCSTDKDCPVGYFCVSDPQGKRFCAADCGTFACPSGYDCVDLGAYEKLGASDAGAAGGTGSPTGQDGGTEEAGAKDGGSGVKPHKGEKGCVPPNNQSCECSAATEGIRRKCKRVNGMGTCYGGETCTSGKWGNCDAPVPSREVCDGKDNNCDGLTDEQDTSLTGNDLCSDSGTPPPHGTWGCKQGKCVVADCDEGWTVFPDSLPTSAGCACKVDSYDVGKNNDTCANAVDLGEIKDDSSRIIKVKGTLSSVNDEDWFVFHAKDVNQRPLFNTFRVHVGFAEQNGNPNGEFKIEVHRSKTGSPCQVATKAKDITSYDWCADSVTDKSKPADADQSAYFTVRVYRASGVSPTCKSYELQITNGGTGACPKPDTCGGSS